MNLHIDHTKSWKPGLGIEKLTATEFILATCKKNFVDDPRFPGGRGVRESAVLSD